MTSGSNALSGDARARALSAARAAQKKPSNKGGPIVDHKPNPAFDQLAGYKERLALRQISKLHDLGDPSFRQHDGHPGAMSSIGGRDVINFGSYDYIGLNADPRPAVAAKAAIDTYGVSASASRLTAGERPIHRELEGRLAAHYGVEDALTFVSGHATNVSAVATLVGKDDLVIYDSYIHNSASVGATLSGATRRSFPHNDMDALETILAETAGRYRYTLVMVEGHYSMDGDIPELPRVLDLKKRFGFWLLVDEAHGLGCIGKTGGGMREYYGLTGTEVDVWMGTLSKSLGSTGGYLAGSAAMIDAMKYRPPDRSIPWRSHRRLQQPPTSRSRSCMPSPNAWRVCMRAARSSSTWQSHWVSTRAHRSARRSRRSWWARPRLRQPRPRSCLKRASMRCPSRSRASR